MPSLRAVELRHVSAFLAYLELFSLCWFLPETTWSKAERVDECKPHVETQVGIGAMSPRLVTVGFMCCR